MKTLPTFKSRALLPRGVASVGSLRVTIDPQTGIAGLFRGRL